MKMNPAEERDKLDALVALTRAVRPSWETPGIQAAIRNALARDVQPTIAELAYALIRCAENPTINTPAVVAMDGPHWGKSTRDPQEPERTTRCKKCAEFHKPSAKCNPDSWMHRTPEKSAFFAHIEAARVAAGGKPRGVPYEDMAAPSPPSSTVDPTTPEQGA